MEQDMILIDRLAGMTTFEMCWNEKEITLQDIAAGIGDGIQEQNQEYGSIYTFAPYKPDEWHIGRVMYFINHPEEIKEIDVENVIKDGKIFPIPIIIDGNHRFMAAMYLQDKGLMERVPCCYGGRLDLLDYLTGKTDVRPDIEYEV